MNSKNISTFVIPSIHNYGTQVVIVYEKIEENQSKIKMRYRRIDMLKDYLQHMDKLHRMGSLEGHSSSTTITVLATLQSYIVLVKVRFCIINKVKLKASILLTTWQFHVVLLMN